MIDVSTLIWSYIYAVTITIIVITVYGMATRPNIVKKLILLSILSDTGNLIAVMIGVHAGMIKPPVFPGISFTDHPVAGYNELLNFAGEAVDPIPQVLVVTAIVIGLAVLVFLGYVTLLLYQKYGTLDVRLLEKKIRGEKSG
ncbi:Na+/H+ antiporter subunit C [Staphylothermus hellenicus]|uniref:NADH-ubiquinone oxidoreductase chain 4L n=1 Tax=Staphylothermus hellenicus (strain DSM 12710 / JCM 10830 / BK20S6-10-b1 / P8) TaxID=591019 RepID=D7DAT3_STAHD|nr:Na+/H+ antiporter subunit C [Staphylothermus hellenicus]ADI31280.1 NADH-ubiquinone oxidoreductase chain 4L [Staphylothermus hellenicus DSM 12710]